MVQTSLHLAFPSSEDPRLGNFQKPKWCFRILQVFLKKLVLCSLDIVGVCWKHLLSSDIPIAEAEDPTTSISGDLSPAVLVTGFVPSLM